MIHKHFFGDLYEWAGQERTIDFTKAGSLFARKEFISKELNKIFSQLKSENYLCDLSQKDFCHKLSYYFNEINAAHPFREGNGRTLRAFSSLLSQNAGYYLDWTKTQKDEYTKANIAGFNGNYTDLENIFNKISSILDMKQNIEIFGESLDENNIEGLKKYVDMQVQLTELVRQKNQTLVKNPEFSKSIAEEVKELSQSLIIMSKEIITFPKNQEMLKLPYVSSLQQQGGFEAIQKRFKNNEIRGYDILCVLRYARNQVLNASQSLDSHLTTKKTGRHL